ncbi:MAG: 50S ribosomal protein L18 [Candidatus Woesearchaeota archaeon]
MATKRYTLRHRRRREQKTNYKSRLALLKSRQVRVVVRKTNAHTSVQFVSYEPDGDVVLASANTAELAGLGWKAAGSNLPAAYLVGFIAGVRASKAGVTEAVADLGMQRPTRGGRLFAAVQGVLDAEVVVPISQEVLPTQERVVGEHIDTKLASQIDAVKKKVQ